MKAGATLLCSDLQFAVPGRTILDGVTFEVARESLAVVGPSGVGKTTLLHIAGGILTPSRGSVEVCGRELTALSSSARAAFRLEHVGLIFQFAELLDELTVVENVSLPLRLLRRSRAAAETAAQHWLDRVGLSTRGSDRPAALSGGEMQRVAVARALAHEPALVLADEPTGSLDSANAQAVTDLLVEQCALLGAGLVMVTHDLVVAGRADRIAELQGGLLIERCAVA